MRLASQRDALNRGEVAFGEVVEREGLRLRADELHHVGHWITPLGPPRRFDTRFFAVDAATIAHKVDNVVHPDAELVELVWMPISEARSLASAALRSVMSRKKARNCPPSTAR